MRFRLAGCALVPLLAACSGAGEGETFTVRTRLLTPADVADPLAGLATVRVRVLQDGEERASRDFAPDETWKIPTNGVDAGDPIVVRIDGLDAGGGVVRTGGTRALVPDDAGDRTFGIFFSTPGEFAQPPQLPATMFRSADVLALPDGRVLAFGGEDELGGYASDVVLYDPDEGTWRSLAPMSAARSAAAVAVLPDGLTLLVAGGVGDGDLPLATTERYRVPAIGADAADLGDTTPGPALPSPWYGMQAGRLASGKIVLAGGYAGDTPVPPQVFDPATSSLSEIAGGVYAEAAAVVSVADGRVAILGGLGTGTRVDVVADAGNGVSLTAGDGALRVSRHRPAAIAAGGARIAVFGGETPAGGPTAAVEVVDLTGATPVSAIVDRERVQRSVRQVEVLGDGRVLVAGGNDLFGASGVQASVFDPATNRIEEVGDLPVERAGRRYTAPMADGTVFVGGGDLTADVRIFQPPVDPLGDGGDRVTFTLTPIAATRETGASLDGVTTLRARFFDGYSEVFEHSDAAGATLAVPGFLCDTDVHVVLEGLDGGGDVVAWGATVAPLDFTAQQAGAQTLLLGRVGEFSLAPNALPNGHADGAAAQLDDGRVVVVGGDGGADTMDAFDPATGATANLATDIGQSRRDVRYALLDDALFLVGGLRGDGVPTAATSLLDLAQAAWTPANALPSVRSKHVAVRLNDGNVLAHGHDVTLDRAAVASRWNGATWASLTAPRARSHHRGVLLEDGTVLLTAGVTTNGAAQLTLSAGAETYDPGDNGFDPTAGNLATARRDHALFRVPGGAVVCGGVTSLPGAGTITPNATCERYDRMARTFSAAGTLSVARDDAGVVTFGDVSWVIGGGQGSTGGGTAAVDVWNGAIAAGPSLRVPRINPSAAGLSDGRIVVAGGGDNGNVIHTSVELYTPPAWTNPFGY